MDKAARKVLKSEKRSILQNLFLNDEILASLENRDILTEDMVQTIKAERTDNDKIVKLLHILTRRGPFAFKVFVEAIRPDFSFLSDMLETKYTSELENGDTDPNSETSSEELSRNYSNESVDEEAARRLCRNCNQRIQVANQISEMEYPASGTSDFLHRLMQEFLRCWYTKLKCHMTNRNLRELSFNSPGPVTYNMVDQLIDELIGTVDGCYRVLGVKDNIVTHIITLKESKKKLKNELSSKEEQRNKYADRCIKLEDKVRDLTQNIEVEKRNNQKLNAEKINLKKEMEVQLQEKDKEFEELNEQLTVALRKAEQVGEMLEKANSEINILQEHVDSYENRIGKQKWQLHGGRYESTRSRSRDDYFESRHFHNYKQHTPRNMKSTESTTMTSKRSKGIGAEEFTSATVETDDSTHSLKQNSSDFGGNKKRLNKNNAIIDNNFKHMQQTLMISNNSNKQANCSEPTDDIQTKSSHSDNIKPRRKAPGANQQTYTFAAIQHSAQRKVRSTLNQSPRALEKMFITNSKPTPNESPTSPKAMKHH